jgi:hypothetical protein
MSEWDGDERRQLPPPHVIYRYVDEHIQAQADTRFKLRTFSDIQAFISIVIVMVAGLAWGLKLDNRIEDVSRQTNECRVTLAKGILPVAEERLIALMHRISALERGETNATRQNDYDRSNQH